MQTVALVILLLLAFALIGVVLLQRNEGGGLGMGGSGGAMGGRGAATGLARATWWIGGAFMATSLALTVIAAQEAGQSSVVDQLRSGGAQETEEAPADSPLGGGSLLPPPAGGATEAPLVPAGD